MVKNKAKYYTFDEVARLICSYLDDPEAKRLYIKVSKGLMLALQELNLYSFPSVKTSYLEVESNLTVALPDDAMSVVKVGVCCENRNGHRVVQPIIQNNDLCLPKDEEFYKCCDCTKEVNYDGTINEEASESCSKCSFHNPTFDYSRWFGGYYSRHYFGYSPNPYIAGAYRHDEQNNRIVLGGGCKIEPGGEVVVEYHAANNEQDYMMIPKIAYMTLQHHVAHWCKSNKQPNVAQYEFNMFRRYRRMMKGKLLSYTLEDILQGLRSGYKSSPKR